MDRNSSSSHVWAFEQPIASPHCSVFATGEGVAALSSVSQSCNLSLPTREGCGSTNLSYDHCPWKKALLFLAARLLLSENSPGSSGGETGCKSAQSVVGFILEVHPWESCFCHGHADAHVHGHGESRKPFLVLVCCLTTNLQFHLVVRGLFVTVWSWLG